jgi:hypothetical protein
MQNFSDPVLSDVESGTLQKVAETGLWRGGDRVEGRCYIDVAFWMFREVAGRSSKQDYAASPVAVGFLAEGSQRSVLMQKRMTKK